MSQGFEFSLDPNLADIFPASFFSGEGQLCTQFSQSWVDYAKFVNDVGTSQAPPDFILGFRYVAPFGKQRGPQSRFESKFRVLPL